MKRKASAVWEGGLKDGASSRRRAACCRTRSTSFATRFENGVGIAAAHAGCFSMALSGQLGSAGMTARSIQTSAIVLRWRRRTPASRSPPCISTSAAAIPGADPEAFAKAGSNAKTECPSRVLNAKITMDARLEA